MNFTRIWGWIRSCERASRLRGDNGTPLSSLTPYSVRLCLGLTKLLLLLALVATAGISHAAGIPWSNNQAAEFSIGTGSGGSGNSGFNNPYSVAIDATHLKLYVADLNNNRVLRFAYPLATNGATAEAVFGQSDFTGTSANRGGSRANNTLQAPCGLALAANGDLWISDKDNNRVVKISSAYNAANGAAASVVLGQADFTSNFTDTSNLHMRTPAGLSIDAAGNLWVADMGNHRVLRFAGVAAKTNGAAADGELGQVDFNGLDPNRGGSAAANTLSGPYGVCTSGATLWVADDNNNRVLRFANAAGKANGADADGVLGQADFTSVSNNRGGSIAGNTLFAAGGVAVDAAGTLYVADGINYRVLIFSDAASKANGAAADNYLGTSSFTTSGNLASWHLTYDDTYHRLVVANTVNSFVNQYFNGYTTTTTIASSLNPSKISGAPVTFTATVTTADGGPMASGTVNFKEDGTILGSGTLNGSGVATFATTSLIDGNHNIVAEYLQSASHKGSSSSVLAQVIGMLTPFTLTAIANSERDNDSGVDTIVNGPEYGNTIYVGGYGSPGYPFYMTPALKFDLSSVTGAVVSATLKMRVNDKSSPATLSVDLYGSTDDSWSDTTTPPPTMPSSKVTPAITTFTPTAVAVDTWISLDVTSFVQAQYSGDKVASFVLESTVDPETMDYVAFFSREAGAGYAPVLDIRTSTAPTVAAVNPPSGPTAGGTSVAITGTNFTAATAVKFGSTNAASCTVNSATQITATSPAGSAGTVDVTVVTAGGTSVTSTSDRFTYVAPSTVTFNSNGGSAVTSQSITYNTTATAPTAPTKTGYSFAGWYSDSGLTSAFNFTTAITADTTLYAKWTINSYTVTPSAGTGGGISPNTPQTVNYNTSTTFTITPATGYRVALPIGGTCSGTYSGDVSGGSYTTTAVTADCTVIAGFIPGNITATRQNITIGSGASTGGSWSGGTPDVWSPSATGATVSAAEIQTRLNSGSGVVISTNFGSGAESGDINVSAPLSWTSGSLTLDAAHDVRINADMSATGASALAMNTSVTVSGGTVRTGSGGRVDFDRSGSGLLTIDGAAYTVLNSLGSEASTTGADLQGISGGLSANYAQGADIAASDTASWNSGDGFLPLGNAITKFTGIFDGLGHTITGLTISRSGASYVGLFGFTSGATMRNLGLAGGSVTGNAYVGGLVGQNGYVGNSSTISNAYNTGSVTGSTTVGGNYIGGLVGWNCAGTIDTSFSSGVVTGYKFVGGLAGENYTGSISNSYSSGSVNGYETVGGIVGYSYASLTNVYSSGAVTATTTTEVGGLGSGSGFTNSFWDTTTSGQSTGGGTGKTTSEMKTLSTFSSVWDISANAGSTNWRIYEGQSYPLLRSFLNPLTVTADDKTKTYDGSIYSDGYSVSYSTTPDASLLGTASYSGTSQAATAVGSYTIIPSGLYSNQLGYDISYLNGTLTITAAPPSYSLTVNFAGNGGNKVESTSPDHGINCLKGSPGSGCSASYVTGTPVTLQATPDWKSTFIGWSGDYISSDNPGTVTVTADKTVTATFDPNNKAKLIPGGALFASIQDAYASVPSGSMTIQAQAWSFLEDLLFSNGTAVTLTGGMDESYNPTSGHATVKSLTVGTGSAVIGNITIK